MDYYPPTSDIETYLKEGDHYRQNNLWDAAISEYQKALKVDSHNLAVFLRLGLAYEGKGTQMKEPVFFHLAMENYRKVVIKIPNDPEANNRMINLGIKMGQLDILISNFKSRLDNDPQNPFLQDCWKKLQALSLVAIPPVTNEKISGRNWIRFIWEVSLIISLVAGMLVPRLGKFRIVGVLILLGYLWYKVSSRQKTKENGQW